MTMIIIIIIIINAKHSGDVVQSACSLRLLDHCKHGFESYPQYGRMSTLFCVSTVLCNWVGLANSRSHIQGIL
jgi:hypothetical protein